jgi:hypothetical protein
MRASVGSASVPSQERDHGPMGLAITGALMIAFPLTMRIVALRAISRSPKATPTPWTWTLRAPMMWAGVVLVIGAIDQTAGEIALGIGLVVLLAFGAKLLINAPGATLTAWRTIGDPDAWRGSPAVDQDADKDRFGNLLWHKIALGMLGGLLLVLIATLAGQH